MRAIDKIKSLYFPLISNTFRRNNFQNQKKKENLVGKEFGKCRRKNSTIKKLKLNIYVL